MLSQSSKIQVIFHTLIPINSLVNRRKIIYSMTAQMRIHNLTLEPGYNALENHLLNG